MGVGEVLAVKVAEVAPAGTTTVLGTITDSWSLLDNVIVSPPVAAGALMVTVPVVEVPPITDAGFILSEVRSGPGTALKSMSTK
jgi:hypothetical protein